MRREGLSHSMLRRFLRPQNHICTAAERQRDMSVRCQTVSVRNSSVRIIEAPSGISQVTVVKTALVSEAPPVQAALGLALNSDTFFLQTEQGVYSNSASRSSTTVYYKACTKHFPVLLCTTKKFAQSTSQYYFVLQSLHKVVPSTTVYYKACTTKLAQTRPSTTVYYKACTNTFQYYWVLQKVCTNTLQ